MPQKKVLPPPSTQSVDETPVPKLTAPAPKSSGLAATKSAAKVAKAAPTKASAKATAKTVTKTVIKAAAKKTSPAPSPAAGKNNSRSPARSPTSSASRKSVRVKKPALVAAPASPLEPVPSHAPLAELASPASHPSASAPESKAAEKPPVVNDAELWEQGSPIRTRIAQLRTRNAFLEEQLQRWRPPVVQVRGKKK
jgi:hypothetical protein